MTHSPRHDVDRFAAAIERAEMPSILFTADIIRHFPRVQDEGAADAAIRAGLFGPWFLVAGVPAVLREDLREHLRLRTVQRIEAHKEVLGTDAPPAKDGGRR